MNSEITVQNNILSDIEMDESVKSYFNALAAITPNIFKTESYGIYLYSPKANGQPVVKIIRFCVEYNDQIFGIQDEIFFPAINEGAQINFRITDKLVFKEAPATLGKNVMKFIDEFKAHAAVKGATISVNGYGVVFESDGEKWVRKNKSLQDIITDELIANGELMYKSHQLKHFGFTQVGKTTL